MDNNFLASMIRASAPTMGAVGVALYVFEKSAQAKYRMGKTLAASFVAYHVSGWVSGKLLGLFEPGAGELPTTPLMLPAPITSTSTPLPQGVAELQDETGNVLSITTRKPPQDFSGGMRP